MAVRQIKINRWLSVLLCFLCAESIAAAQRGLPRESWTTTWGSAQEAPYGTDVLSSGALQEATLREVVRLSVGGGRLRVRLSNAFGERALVLRAVHVALLAGGGAAIDPGTDRILRFGGQASVSIPMGADYLSDPLDFTVVPLSDLVVSLALEKAPRSATFHAGARATSFLAGGDHAADAQLAAPKTFAQWYFLAGVEVADARLAGAVVTLGDSITDGHGATTDGNDRWPDVLARRLAASGHRVGVVNMGIGGNRLLEDGIGPNAMSRFDRDVLSPAGVRSVVVLEGINDLGGLDRTEEHGQSVHDGLVGQLERGFEQMVAKAHAHGIRVYGATVTPYLGSGYYHPNARSEADRQALNRWIRTSHTFDEVIDFDAVLNDPDQPGHLLPAVDSGDHLHPGPAGYKRMAEAIPISLFTRSIGR